MQTATGGIFWPVDPWWKEVNLVDIALSLGKQCRFNGHCIGFYSVAEHSVLVSHCVPPEYAMMALMHDATEAYCADIHRPLKPFLENYAWIEGNIWSAVAEKFNLPAELPVCVKDADNAVLLAEKKAIMHVSPKPWNVPGEAANVPIRGLLPEAAAIYFLTRFYSLKEGRPSKM